MSTRSSPRKRGTQAPSTAAADNEPDSSSITPSNQTQHDASSSQAPASDPSPSQGFLYDLFTSIFTPGPTHSLLLATNVSFAALQGLLLVMLLVTYSVHFIVLSLLCGGLWWGINWFVRELKAEEQRTATARAREGEGDGEEKGEEVDRKVGASKTRKAREAGHAHDAGEAIDEGQGTGDEMSTSGEWDKIDEANVYKRR